MKPTTIMERAFPKDYPELKKMSNDSNIICVCYGQAVAFPSRNDAIAFYRERVQNGARVLKETGM